MKKLINKVAVCLKNATEDENPKAVIPIRIITVTFAKIPHKKGTKRETQAEAPPSPADNKNRIREILFPISLADIKIARKSRRKFKIGVGLEFRLDKFS